MPPSPPIQCCVNDWKEKIQPTFSNIDHGGRGGGATYFKMAKNVKSLIIFARDCSWVPFCWWWPLHWQILKRDPGTFSAFRWAEFGLVRSLHFPVQTGWLVVVWNGKGSIIIIWGSIYDSFGWLWGLGAKMLQSHHNLEPNPSPPIGSGHNWYFN
jgi:hypothetical protein